MSQVQGAGTEEEHQEFADKLVDHLRKHKDIPDIPKSQRYVNRPGLDNIFPAAVLKDRKKRDRKIVESVEKHGYTQRAIAAHLEMHYSYISQIVKNSRPAGFWEKERKDKC